MICPHCGGKRIIGTGDNATCADCSKFIKVDTQGEFEIPPAAVEPKPKRRERDEGAPSGRRPKRNAKWRR